MPDRVQWSENVPIVFTDRDDIGEYAMVTGDRPESSKLFLFFGDDAIVKAAVENGMDKKTAVKMIAEMHIKHIHGDKALEESRKLKEDYKTMPFREFTKKYYGGDLE